MWWNILNKSKSPREAHKRHQRLQTHLDAIALKSFEDNAGTISDSPAYFTGGAPNSPLVLCSPHSGRHYPREFIAQTSLDLHALRRSEDCYVDTFIRDLNTAWIAASFPRIYVDPNRSPEEWPLGTADLKARGHTKITPRVQVGLGLVPTRLSQHEEIYPLALSANLVRQRIKILYEPFHAALYDLLTQAKTKFGHALLLDFHSMPSTGLDGQRRADIVLGDRFGSACTSTTRAVLYDAFSELGYIVAMNAPYAGGYITEHYGKPNNGTQAVQIEINKGLYVDETTYELKQDASKLRQDIKTVVAMLENHLAQPSEIAAQ